MIEALEYPKPILSGLKEFETKDLQPLQPLQIQTKNATVIKLRNSGGGTLAGRIISPTKSLIFEPSTWESNRVQITCRFTPDPLEGWKPGDVRQFQVRILSNGGEATIPITARLEKMAISISANQTIANLTDFYEYAEKSPQEAEDLFADSEFHMLLLAMDFPYTDAYTMLVKEPNRKRAVDNFLILAGLKKRTKIQIPDPVIEHRTIKNSIINGNFTVQKSDSGYVEASVQKESDAPWLAVDTTNLKTEDFTDNTVQINYKIDPLHIKGRYSRELIKIKSTDGPEEVTAEIVFKRPEPLKAYLQKEGYRYQDEGTVVVENELDEPLQVEISCKEQFIRFYQKEYKVEGKLSIPFIVKLTPLQSAQMLFRKIPSLSAEIEIKSTHKGTGGVESIVKIVKLTAGQW